MIPARRGRIVKHRADLRGFPAWRTRAARARRRELTGPGHRWAQHQNKSAVAPGDPCRARFVTPDDRDGRRAPATYRKRGRGGGEMVTAVAGGRFHPGAKLSSPGRGLWARGGPSGRSSSRAARRRRSPAGRGRWGSASPGASPARRALRLAARSTTAIRWSAAKLWWCRRDLLERGDDDDTSSRGERWGRARAAGGRSSRSTATTSS